MQLLASSDGTVRCLYNETLNLAEFGRANIYRASHVEPDETGRWFADLSPVSGPVLGPHAHRSEALAAERQWLEANLLCRASAYRHFS